MSKKSRRARARRQNIGQLTKSMNGVRPQVSNLAPASRTFTPSIVPSVTSNKMAQHQYVLPELRNIGIITGALLLVLIALTFVLS